MIRQLSLLLIRLPTTLRVFITFAATLSLFYSGHLYSTDTVTKIEAARNFVKYGSFHLESLKVAWGQVGRDTKMYGHFSIGSELVVLPAVVTHTFISRLFPALGRLEILNAMVTFANVLLSAGLGTLCFQLLLRLGFTYRQSLLFASALLFGTLFLPYSGFGFSEPAAAVFALWSFCAIIDSKGDTSVRLRDWVLWGLLGGAAALIRLELLVFFALAALIFILRHKSCRKALMAGIALFALTQTLHVWFNFHRYGAIGNFGYVDGSSNGLWGVLGPIVAAIFSVQTLHYASWFLLTFGKVHWFWAAPALALIPAIILYRRLVPPAVLSLFIAALFFSPLYIFFINTFAWASTCWCWSFRYFSVMIPLLLLPLAWVRRGSRKVNGMFKIATLTGVFISAIVALTNYHIFLERFVKQCGYQQGIFWRPNVVWHAPFWYHLTAFPNHLFTTAKLLSGSAEPHQWELLRQTALDIWPVTLVGAGFAALPVFVLYALLIATTVALWVYVFKSPTDYYCDNKL